MRFDILRFNSGATIATVRRRLDDNNLADPVVLVRRQGVTLVTWYRISLDRLREVSVTADEGDVLSTHIGLDPANEVPAISLESVSGDGDWGVVLLDGEAIAFMDGTAEPVLDGTRGGDAPVLSPPPAPAQAAPPPTARPLPTAPPPPTSAGEPESEENGPRSTFHAFPSIDAPTTVEPEREFGVAVGVTGEPARHTTSPEIEVPDLPPDQETITLEILVSGPFTVAEGSKNTGEIEVDRSSLAHVPFTVRLIPGSPPDTYDPHVGVWTADIIASFFHEGVFLGEARREVRVNQMGARAVTVESDGSPTETRGVELTRDDTVDLIIAITRDEPGATGHFNVRLLSKHLPSQVDAGTIDLGTDPAGFAAGLIEEIGYTVANKVSDETLNTIARTLADQLPDGVVGTIEQVWEELNPPDTATKVPDVLLLTDDWAVPWELMALDIDPDRPGFLGAQVNLGRWPAPKRTRLHSESVGVRGLGVMVGYYQDARGVVPLPRAEEEGRDLEGAYLARAVNADHEAFDQLLSGRFQDGFEFEGLHFAGHGEADPARGTYLMYSDGARMGTLAWGSAQVASERGAFLFVNACQVGTAAEILNQYGGLAGHAVNAGFRGFVAPLWSVSDDVARDISIGLYQASADGATVSGYLRDVRSNFKETDERPAHTTYLAYVFYGHPSLKLGGPEKRTGP